MRDRFQLFLLAVFASVFALAVLGCESAGQEDSRPTPSAADRISAEGLYAEREANAERFDQNRGGTLVRVSGIVCGIESGDVRLYSDASSRQIELCLTSVTLQGLSEEELIVPSTGERFEAVCEVGNYILGTMFLEDCRVP